jgi:hypothetical protein
MKLFGFSLVLTVLAGVVCAGEPIEFNRDIRPLLSDRCFKCHGPDENTRESGLRLDTFEGATAHRKNSDHYFAIVPGKPAESDVIHRIFTDDADELMPPPKSGLKLSNDERELLKRWVEKGAVYEKHWSFMPVKRRDPPDVSQPRWCRNPIDHFILKRLEHEGLTPSEPADKLTLLKRVSFDLTGLPPTPAEIDAFLADDSPEAYEKAVDRLLASEAYGERMALIWVDAARYADTSGYQADWERFMWPWREWAIKAYNANMPFDQFTIEQLAGDLLPNPSLDQMIATGFNRNHRINDEGGVIAEEFLVEYVVDRVETVSTVWMGLTMGCARCHDHKYDPLSQKNFYEMFSIFNNVPEKGKDGRAGWATPTIDYPIPEKKAELKKAKEELADLIRKSDAEHLDARNAWLDELNQQDYSQEAVVWISLELPSVESTKGLTFKKLKDGSFLAQPPVVENPVYTLSGNLPDGTITALRLDVLPDKSFKGQHGLAPSKNGNFVLTDFTIELTDAATAETSAVPIKEAQADYSQKNWPVQHAIDDKSETGWAIMGGGDKDARTAIFLLETPVANLPNNQWTVTLRHDTMHSAHYIGRFKVAATMDKAPRLDVESDKIPSTVKKALLADDRSAEQEELLSEYYRDTHPSMKNVRESIASHQKKITEIEKDSVVKVMVMNEMNTPRETYVLNRGQYDQPDKDRRVFPAVPDALGELSQDAPKNRLGFARWLVNGENPLTGRVTMNRYWQMYFGRGLVETAEDFGAQGSLPTHPELLDWLASEFVRSGWNVKAMQKLIVMSATYQQSSKVSPELLEKDPKNILLARGPRFRLSGYQIRDQALAVSGLLVKKLGGPSVKPYQPPGLWAEVSFQDKKRSTDFFVQDHGEKLYRRSLYTFWKRSVAPPQMATFDAAGREACAVNLIRTSTPLQALTLMNDMTFLEAARHMAVRMMEQGDNVHDRLAYGLKLISAEPDQHVLAILERGLADYRAAFLRDKEAAKALTTIGESPARDELDTAEHAAWTAVASVLLNLDQTITKE